MSSIVLNNVDIDSNGSFSSFLLCQNESDRVNYGTLYPRGVKRTRDFFSYYGVTAVDIGLSAPVPHPQVNAPSFGGNE